MRKELEDGVGLDASDALLISAKTGVGIDEVLEAVVQRIPPPRETSRRLCALIFDSHFDPYHGAIAYVRVVDGQVRVGAQIRMMSSGRTFTVTELRFDLT